MAGCESDTATLARAAAFYAFMAGDQWHVGVNGCDVAAADVAGPTAAEIGRKLTAEKTTASAYTRDLAGALLWLEQGKRVTRRSWPMGNHLSIGPSAGQLHHGHTGGTVGYLWTPVVADLVADDWMVV